MHAEPTTLPQRPAQTRKIERKISSTRSRLPATETESAHPVKSAGLNDVPQRVREIAMLRGLGYSFREIATPLHVSPQAVSLMLYRHRRSLQSLRGAMELSNLSARAVNALGRHGIHTREEARRREVLELLSNARNCGKKTLEEIALWVGVDTTANGGKPLGPRCLETAGS
jgi:predicted transcriptional regulator